MSHKKVCSWKTLEAALKRHGVDVGWRGSEAKLVRIEPGARPLIYILQHQCCKTANSTVWATHLSRIRRLFGLTDEDLQG